MRYFETKHEKKSAKITTLVMLILIVLIFIAGPKYDDPPLEYGVAINFGDSNFGSGKVQPKTTTKALPQKVNEPLPEETKVEEAKVEQTKVEEIQPKTTTPIKDVKEEVITSDNSEAIAIKKQKEAEAKLKAEEVKLKEKEAAKAKALLQKAEAERIAKEKKEKADKKNKLDALIGGIGKPNSEATGSEGDDDKKGDKGQLNGTPYGPSYFGTPGAGTGGVGYGLNGRGTPTKTIVKQNCNEEGRVVVKITVNKMGDVIKAEPGIKGTTNSAACLLEPAKKTALSHKWRADPNAPNQQIGFIVINFSISQ